MESGPSEALGTSGWVCAVAWALGVGIIARLCRPNWLASEVRAARDAFAAAVGAERPPAPGLLESLATHAGLDHSTGAGARVTLELASDRGRSPWATATARVGFCLGGQVLDPCSICVEDVPLPPRQVSITSNAAFDRRLTATASSPERARVLLTAPVCEGVLRAWWAGVPVRSIEVDGHQRTMHIRFPLSRPPNMVLVYESTRAIAEAIGDQTPGGAP